MGYKLAQKIRKNLILIVAFTIGFILCISFTSLTPNVKYGQPINTKIKDDFIISRSQYLIGYNKASNRLNWASWELNSSWLGSIIRSNIFITDKTLPSNYAKVFSSDYINSGYDRGHMVNSQDRSNNQTNNDSTFILTNILPQTPDNNRGPWEKLESYSRSLVKSNSSITLYITAGPIDSIGKLNGKVDIPKSFYKTILVEQNGKPVKGFAVVMPNVNGIINDNWTKYIVPIRAVETVTNYNFYPNLDIITSNKVELTANY